MIYEPTGPAREYAALALNIYKGCSHGCRYCFGPATMRKTKEIYFANADLKKNVIAQVKNEVAKMNGHIPEILLSFIGDVYQPAEVDLGITRQVIEILIAGKLPFTILTKGGTRAARDFDLLESYPQASFGTTLVFITQKHAAHWEPGAASIDDRISAIREAHDRGIRTWVSLEPVIEPGEALEVIRQLHPIVDHWKVGKLNHNKEIEAKHDWRRFKAEVVDLFSSVGADYYVKRSLAGHER